ncbi:class I adenylate-forming enzyme family protein [Streptomyces europaeiscabiei]|uniref:class I adenylate-forming enzyme family protein n=1 Tax=Streptomyces europaeiscabiei TaxID=146819 RepID=UPI0029BB6D01|nr:class I adenylate-forming enzyme family protein [Streptomyces europaeiscabiei]MDX2525302.1 class I adenylate-forming enzyme family protein [Streptomyces europaeiscabiei]
MLDLLRHRARDAPGRPAVQEHIGDTWRTTTWAELYTAAQAAAARAARLRAGSGPVTVVLDNSAASVAALVGLLSSSLDVLCVERADLGPPADHVVAPVGTPGAAPGLTHQDLTAPLGGLAPEPHGGPRPGTASGEAAVLQVTSGSTGQPRVVRHRVSAVLHGAGLYRDLYGVTDRDKVLLPLPFAHSFGLVGGLTCALLSGAVLLTSPVFRLRAVHAALAAGASVLLGSPLLYDLLAASAADGCAAPRLRVALSSGGPLSPRTAEAAEAVLGVPVSQVYGSTETGLIACWLPGEPTVPGSVGTAAPGVTWRLGAAEEGGHRLLVRTDTMLLGYHGPLGTEPDPDGYFDTGDLAVVDAVGRLRITARKSTFINVGGRKVNPQRVEARAEDHPLVREAKAFGRARGNEQEVHMAVVVEDPVAVDATVITSFLRAGLAPHEVPRHLHFLNRLPRTSLGKVNLPALLQSIPAETAYDHGQ